MLTNSILSVWRFNCHLEKVYWPSSRQPRSQRVSSYFLLGRRKEKLGTRLYPRESSTAHWRSLRTGDREGRMFVSCSGRSDYTRVDSSTPTKAFIYKFCTLDSGFKTFRICDISENLLQRIRILYVTNKANSVLNRSGLITVLGFSQRDTVTGDVKTISEICAIIPLCIRNLLFLESPSPVYNGNYDVWRHS